MIISQFLIINYWGDTKFATIANVVILLFLLGEYSGYRFKNQIKEERIALFENSQPTSKKNITEEAVFDLPPIVQRWLTHSGVIGKEPVSNVYLVQELQLKMKPGQEGWKNGRAEQYFTVQPPAFNWNLTLKV